MAKNKPKVYGITGKQAARIRRACERVEGTPPGSPFGEPASRPGWNPGVLRGKVATAIPAGTFAAPSAAGKVQLYELDHDGDWVESGEPVEVKNQFGGGPIAVGDSVLVAWIAGQLFVVAADCPKED